MRLARTDLNQHKIVRELRSVGFSVQSLAKVGNGCPDIVVGVFGKNYLFEIKNPEQFRSHRKLTSLEQEWHYRWNGQVDIIESFDDALKIIHERK